MDGDTIHVGNRELTVRIVDGDDEQPSTLVLKTFKVSEEVEQAKPRITMTMPTLARSPVLSAHQRCPRCSAAVSELDEECSTCGFQWGSFRSTSRTDVRPNPLNRRRFDRQPIELHLVYTSSELEIEAMSRDLSESGVFVCSQVLDPIGTECELRILVDGGPAIDVRGVVRRVVEREVDGEPIGLGVEFVGLGEQQRSWIRTTIDRMNAGVAS